ncbi:hypothetical protein DV736_g3686, partial [Chaetothyriales sp. CBS 134916]
MISTHPGNTGLGFEVVKALYTSSHSYEIIVGSRLISKAEAAIESLQKEAPQSSSTLSIVQVDVSSDASIDAALKDIASKHGGRLDILINNAGANFDGDIASGKLGLRDAFNTSWDTNVSGTHVITTGAIPLLLKSSDPRLLFVTSGTSALTETELFNNPGLQRINASPAPGWPKEKTINPITSYRSTKTGLNMLMREWHRILLNDGIKVWAISPGFLATGLAGISPDVLREMGALDPSIGGQFIKDVVEGKRDSDVGKAIRNDGLQPW